MPLRSFADAGRRLGRGTGLVTAAAGYRVRPERARKSTYAHVDGTDRAPEHGYQDELELDLERRRPGI